MNNRYLATLAIENCDPQYLDPSYYANAVSTNSLKQMDYFHSRVTHNPAYSNKLIQEAYKHFHPKFEWVPNLGNFEFVSASTQNQTDMSTNFTSSPTKQAKPGKLASYSKLIDQVIHAILDSDTNHVNQFKCFSFYLVSSNQYSSHLNLVEHISHFRSILYLKFADLIKYIGSRNTAEHEREVFRSLFKEVIGEMS